MSHIQTKAMTMVPLLIFLTGFLSVKCTPVEVTHVKKWIDLSYAFNENTIYHPYHRRFEMEQYNGSVNGVWYQAEIITSNTHTGTHMDAPTHFVLDRWSAADIPIEHLMMVPAAVVDFSQKALSDPDSSLEIEDLEQWEAEHGQIPKGSVLMMHTGYGAFVNDTNRYFGIDGNELHFPGLAPSAAQWLVDNREIYGVGIDTASFDTAVTTGNFSHIILLDKNIYGLENVANMDKLPPVGATLYVVPMKISNGSGAPCRIIASVIETITSTRSEQQEDNSSSSEENND